MKLHHDVKLFSDTIRAASQRLSIIPIYIEKDYWITLVLSQLASSKHAQNVVFKGGTSLSKGYGLINRFSEDVDIAVTNTTTLTGNKFKTLIRNIEKEMTRNLNEKQMEGVSSKGSKFRKSVFEYDSIDQKNDSNRIITEINSFANPYPFQKLTIESFIAKFLTQTKNFDYIKKYNLQSFQINVLDKKQTLLEKLASLIRYSFDENVIQSIASKIRHFYDLYYLLSDAECAAFLYTKEFAKQFNSILNHDKEVFDIPKGWNKKTIKESPLISDFTFIWSRIKDEYRKELSKLAFTEIPSEKDVSGEFKNLIKMLSV
jgi:predicted nucleotidyltransferase component of viral defense system